MATTATEIRSNRGHSAVAPVRPAAGRWQIDAAQSSLQIGVKLGLLATVKGRFTQVTGHLQLADDVLRSEVVVEVPTVSLTSGSSHWDAILMNAGLVDTKANPTIAFESTGLTPNAVGWQLSGVLVTERGCLPVQFDLRYLSASADRIRCQATGSIASKDAVWLLSQPGVERLIGKSMTVDLVVEAVRG